MAKFKIVLNSSLFLALMSNISCINIPIEFTLENPIEIDDSAYKKQAETLRDELLGLVDLGKASRPKACENAFGKWVLKQVDIGLLPKRSVTALEYGKDSTDPLIAKCNGVDLVSKVPEAYKKFAEKSQQELPAVFFRVQEFRDELASKKCSKDYLDPQKRKLALTGMKTNSVQNSLNIESPVYNIYYTTKTITKEEALVAGAEKDFLAIGSIKMLGTTRAFKPGFKGSVPIDFVKDPELKKQALEAFKGLNTDLIAYPAPFSTEPQTTYMGDMAYFLVPTGRLKMMLELDIEANASLPDIQCALKNWREF